ncbi:MAG: hypothetical protein WBN89_16540 [Prochlorococcaceae cyanobacterium]
MGDTAAIKRLDTIPADHPCLWGELAVRDGDGLQTWQDATLLPPRLRSIRTRRPGQKVWWRRHSYGVFDASGQHVRTLSDMRGQRHICHPNTRLEDNRFKPERLQEHELVLYGGTLYDAFGHLILDSGRTYQLMREYRDSDLPVWFHDAKPDCHPGSILKLGLVKAWLKQLGLSRRVRLIRRPLRARQLISCSALYNDRDFASTDLRPACLAALKPRLRKRLEAIRQPRRRLAYLSRHKLSFGSTSYPQEVELVERLARLSHVDVICPEELTFEEKLGLYHRYEVIAGFPQACMGLKLFVPGDQPAQQVMVIAGPRSLSTTWVNIDRAAGWGDFYVDCDLGIPQTGADDPSKPFQRTNSFDTETVLQAIQDLTR